MGYDGFYNPLLARPVGGAVQNDHLLAATGERPSDDLDVL